MPGVFVEHCYAPALMGGKEKGHHFSDDSFVCQRRSMAMGISAFAAFWVLSILKVMEEVLCVELLLLSLCVFFFIFLLKVLAF